MESHSQAGHSAGLCRRVEPVSAPFLNFRTAYYPDHWPESEWSSDLDLIVRAGISTVRFGEFSWSWFESAPGRFDFRAYDRFVELAASKGLRLVLCTPTATPPPWFDVKFPNGRMRNAHGERCLSPRHFWCWNHAPSRRQAEKTIRRLARQYGGHPAVWGWQIDNEPNYAEENHLSDALRGYDFHPASRRAFVAWLRRRYGNLVALNEAWWSDFWSQRCHAWEEAGLVRGKTNPHAWLDFMRWRDEDVAGFVHWQRDLLREISPGKSIGCNIPQAGIATSLAIAQDPWRQAEGLDWVGTDLYEATGHRERDLQRLAFSTDLMRSAAGRARFLISETQAGPHVRWWKQGFAGEGFGPDYINQSVDVYARRGASEVWWFLFRPTLGGHEMGMNGLLEIDGAPGARYKNARRLAQARQAAKWEKARRAWLRRAPARMVYCRESLRFASNQPSGVKGLDDSLCGWHAWLEDAGFRVDFVDARVWKPGRDETDLLVIPFMPLVEESWLDALRGWKGKVWLGPHSFMNTLHGHLRGGEGLRNADAVRGCRLGLWHDGNALPSWSGQPVEGWRELTASKPARVRARLSNRQPALVTCGKVMASAFDWGSFYLRANQNVRSAMQAMEPMSK